MPDFTFTQGRYLAFIHAYKTAFGEAPSHTEIQMALEVTPPSANNMLKMLDRKKLIARQAGVARSIEILIEPEKIPAWDEQLPQSVSRNTVTARSKHWSRRTK